MVAERICRIPIADLTRVRVTCQKCKVSTEAQSLNAATTAIPDGTCRHCGTRFYETRHQQKDLLAELAWAMEELSKRQEVLAVEFVIPESPVAE